MPARNSRRSACFVSSGCLACVSQGAAGLLREGGRAGGAVIPHVPVLSLFEADQKSCRGVIQRPENVAGISRVFMPGFPLAATKCHTPPHRARVHGHRSENVAMLPCLGVATCNIFASTGYRPACCLFRASTQHHQSNTTVLFLNTSTRSRTCHQRAFARTVFSRSRPRRTRSCTLSSWLTRMTS